MFVKFISIVLVFGASLTQANTTSGRIINGNNAPEIIPYHAQLGLRLGSEPERAGSGIIITPRLILTAATNIDGFDTFRAGFGSTNRGALVWVNAIMGETISNYNPITYENNVGFIIFARDALLITGLVVPITIPPATLEQNLPLENEQGRLVGFGWTSNTGNMANTLQYAFNRVVSRQECAAHYYADQDYNFCAVDLTQNSKICAGDQGTAFVTNINGVDYVTGIASYILSYDCVPGVPALFVRTLAYRNYIDTMSSVYR